jgi:hypothetical protein
MHEALSCPTCCPGGLPHPGLHDCQLGGQQGGSVRLGRLGPLHAFWLCRFSRNPSCTDIVAGRSDRLPTRLCSDGGLLKGTWNKLKSTLNIGGEKAQEGGDQVGHGKELGVGRMFKAGKDASWDGLPACCAASLW